MALHISGKLFAVGLVLAALITAFSAPRSPSDPGTPLALAPIVQVLPQPIAVAPTAGRVGPTANPTYVLRATGYNSVTAQTDPTPNLTATGERTHFGVIAVSRDLLPRDLPYGSLVRVTDLGNFYSGRGLGKFQSVLDNQGLFVVEDTMHQRKRNQVDIWFGDYASAVNWGVRKVRVEVVRYGRDGPQLEPAGPTEFTGTPRLTATR